MVQLLVIVGLLAGFVGLATMSNATMGVGFIGFGCLLAILARIEQAARQHLAVMARDTVPVKAV